MVGVYIRRAVSAEDANAQCKASVAYRKICREHPSTTWHRRYVRTIRHNTGPGDRGEVRTDGIGAYICEFEVIEKGS